MSNKVKENSLRSNQNTAIQALLEGKTKGQAAVAAQVRPPTLSRWLTEPDFRAELDKRTEAALQHATRRVALALDTACDILLRAMTADHVDWPVRVRAADLVLSHYVKLVEATDLEERIKALEERANEPKK